MSHPAGGYGRFLRAPGVARLTGAFIALGTSGTMAPVSLVLFARAATGSFAAASGVLAATSAGGLVLGPLRGRLVDRLGPSQAVLRLALPSVATDALFIVAGHSSTSPADSRSRPRARRAPGPAGRPRPVGCRPSAGRAFESRSPLRPRSG